MLKIVCNNDNDNDNDNGNSCCYSYPSSRIAISCRCKWLVVVKLVKLVKLVKSLWSSSSPHHYVRIDQGPKTQSRFPILTYLLVLSMKDKGFILLRGLCVTSS